MSNGILWVLRTGAPWRDLPERFGPWKTVYDYYQHWRDDSTFGHVLQKLQVRLDREGHIDRDLWCIDDSSVRASRAAAGASKETTSSISTNPKSTLWAAREANSASSSTWLLGVSYLAMFKLAVIERCLRTAFSDRAQSCSTEGDARSAVLCFLECVRERSNLRRLVGIDDIRIRGFPYRQADADVETGNPSQEYRDAGVRREEGGLPFGSFQGTIH